MNINEVLATLAAERLGRPVHPNDHVNASAVVERRVPVRRSTSPPRPRSLGDLIPALEHLAAALERKADEFADVVKSGRTHLMDATPVTLGQEFGGYAAQVRLGVERLDATLPRVAELPLGGTAVGTGINTPPGFGGRGDRASSPRATGPAADRGPQPLRGAGRPRRPGRAVRPAADDRGRPDKIANDLRWMGSGPRAGLGEINLPDLQPGSSIMPGKVNPVIPEATLHGVRPGHRQRRRGGLGRRGRATSSST